MAIADTLSFLLGVWDVERLVEDLRSPAPVLFQGRATVEPVEPGPRRALGRRAHYAEKGKIQVGAHSGPASRQLEIVSAHDLAVMIYFTDGRPFLDLDVATGHWLSSHVCGDDHYQIETFVGSNDVLQEYWRVRGPRKDYAAVTTMRRKGL